MDEFCGSQFWDADLTWNTEKSHASPDLTLCFQNTILVWIPCGFLWVFSILNLIYDFGSNPPSEPSQLSVDEKNRSKNANLGAPIIVSAKPKSSKNNNKIQWNSFNVSKVVICVILIITQIARLGNSLKLKLVNSCVLYPVDTYTPVLSMATYAMVLVCIIVSMKKGTRSSILQFTFWLLLVICQTVRFRSTLLKIYQNAATKNRFDMRSFKMEVILEFIDYPLILGQFLLHCWADFRTNDKNAQNRVNKMTDIDDKKLQECPEYSSSALSRLLFSWFDPFAWNGYKKSLASKDLWELNPQDKSEVVNSLFDKNWESILKQNQNSKAHQGQGSKSKSLKGGRVGVLSVIFGAFGGYFVGVSLLKLIPDLLAFASPQILSLLIAFMSSDEDDWKGYFYATLLFIAALISNLVKGQYNHGLHIIGMRVKSAIINALYKKSLVVSSSGKKESTSGEVVNLMSVDINNIVVLLPFVNIVWSAPLQMAIALYFLWDILGPSVFAGIGVMIILIPINLALGRVIHSYQVTQMKNKDERVKLIGEILSGIKILKLYAWEPSFQEEVTRLRRKELNTMKSVAYLSAVCDFLWNCSQFMVALATFGTYVLVDEKNVLDAQKVFVSLSLLNLMAFPMAALPQIIVMTTQASISFGRLNKFLNAEEIDTEAVSHEDTDSDPIVVENASFSWDGDIENGAVGKTDETEHREKNVLKNINLQVQEGSLVAVVGPVGSGKSSLLSAILGELEKTSGRVNTKGSISYVAQQAWIQNGTLRENILFGKPYDARNYNKVIEACALGPDLDIFPARDKIEIGEKGINLSGGQKQRVSIARAVYNNSDLYLFDDPLSAVDSHVGKHIFDKVLSSKGLLRRKTRVLVTNALHFLHQVDRIIVLKSGEISQTGTYEELLAQKGEFAELISQYSNEVEEETPSEVDKTSPTTIDEQREGSISLDGSGDGRKSPMRSRIKSESEAGSNQVEQEKLIAEETMEKQSVKWFIYVDYFRAAGWGSIILSVVLFFIFQAFALASNFWLATWSNEPVVNGTQGNRDLYLGVYTGLGVAQSLSFMVGTVAISFAVIRSASVFHLNMLARILRAPMSFFDTTPIGRIVNRFSKDIDVLDSGLSILIRLILSQGTTLLGTLVVIIYNTPIFVVVIIPIGIFYLLVLTFYIPTSRQLKRLESVTRSPIYSHFGETINGAATIRAYGHQSRFIFESQTIVDENQACYYPSTVAARWLGIRLEMTGSLVIFFTALFTVLGRESLNPGLVGLTVTYALQTTLCLSYVVRAASTLEANIVAVERLQEYGEVPQEAPWTSDLRRPAKTWPADGSVQFKNYQTRYRDGMDLVLRNVTCDIAPGEKIGVVGRTGAGKSSLALALFRIIEGVNEGTITIDGEDIRKLGLHDVRSRLTIIPQDPVLFSGTLRFNLDPFGKYSDSSVWRALELSNLKAFVKGLQGGLEFKVSEGGDNMSVGQKQLVCLARALLRKSKILVLDEATAAVDLETDDLIQKTIRVEFKDSTVITIAHRLNTIMDSTRVMIIDNGSIREFDTPGKLLENPQSLFYAMANDAGLISNVDL